MADLLQHSGLGRPSIDGKSERRLGDEHVAAYRLEGGACAVRLGFVVAGHDPDLAPVFQADLRRPQDMPGRVERDSYAPLLDPHPVFDGIDHRVAAHSHLQHPGPLGRGQVALAPPAGVVGVGVGDHRSRHRPPRVDEEIPRGAVQPAVGRVEQHVSNLRCVT